MPEVGVAGGPGGKLEARRLDGEGTSTAEVREEGYPATGMLPTAVVFSDPGCWELTGRLADTELAVIVNVVVAS